MHFLFSLLRIKGLYMFRALLAHPQEVLNKRHLVNLYCMNVMSVGCTSTKFSFGIHVNTAYSNDSLVFKCTVYCVGWKSFQKNNVAFFFNFTSSLYSFSKKHFTRDNNLLSHNLPWHTKMDNTGRYHISRPIRHTFFPEKCGLNSNCVLCAEGKHLFPNL
jgi:hypothetical protein